MIVLETERLYLREWVPDDWVRFKPLAVEPRVIQYINQGGPWEDDRIENRVREYIQVGQTRGWHLWPVIHRADAKLIGFCGFSDGFPPDVEIGWRLLPDYWGKGLATEAAKATLDYGFKTWNFPRVIAVAQTPNRASIRVMEKIGMSFDATFDDRGTEVVRYVAVNPRYDSLATADSLAPDQSSQDSSSEAVKQDFLNTARCQLTRQFDKIKHCLSQLSDEQVWWRPSEGQNSIGNIILHLWGDVRQWIVSGLGGEPDIRNRPQEFAERGPIPKEELIRRLEDVLQRADAVLQTVSLQQLLECRRIQEFETTSLSAIFLTVAHFKGHTQEIICLTRMRLGEHYQFHWTPATAEQGVT